MEITLPKETAQTKPRAAWRRYGGSVIKYALLIFAAAIFFVPLFWMASASLKDLSEIYTFPPQWVPLTPRWENYVEAWNAAPFGRFYLNTLVTTAFGVGAELLFGTMTAYAFVFLPFPGKNALFILMLAALMIPIQVTMLPNYLTVANLGWLNSYPGIIVPGASVAFGTFLFRQHFLTLPKEILEAARLEGAGHFQLLTKIILPISRPIFATVGLIALVSKWNDFLWPLIVTNRIDMRVLPVGLAYLFDQEGNSQWGIIMAATIFVVAPILLVFAWAQRHIIAGLTAGATKG